MKRGEERECKYQRYASGQGNERARRIEAESRLEHLEYLVQQLAQTGSNTVAAATSTSATSHSSGQNGSVQDHGSSGGNMSEDLAYSGSTHWSAMLEDIEELRFAIAPDDASNGQDGALENDSFGGIDIIFGSTTSLSFEQVLAQYLPPRQEVDRLTAAYFRAKAVAAPFIHAAQFQRLYQVFWQEPQNAPPLWTSMLFSICQVASNTILPKKGSSVEDGTYSTAAAHCLAIGRYFRPKQYSVESLLLFAQARCFASLDISTDVGTILGIVIRLATRMGYHRDPDNFNFSPFEKEMRRRTWSLCVQLDLLVSFQLGLPSNIQYPTWDTRPPANLLDADFDETSRSLPPARPDSELSDILFYIAKHRLVVVFEKILRHVLAVDVDKGPDVDELDAEINTTYASLPETLRVRSMAQSVVDPPYLIVTRLCVYFMYLKNVCVLHRKHVTSGRPQSIQICYESSSNLVRYFLDAYDGFQPGGPNESENWFIMSGITWNDYLLGAMALCLVLCVSSQNLAGTQIDSVAIMKLLYRSRSVCMEQSSRSKDTQRVRKLIDATISRFGTPFDRNQSQESSGGVGTSENQSDSSSVSLSFADHQYMAQNLGLSNDAQTNSIFPPAAWGWEEDMARPIDDVSWSYLEQFLNLSNDDLMADF